MSFGSHKKHHRYIRKQPFSAKIISAPFDIYLAINERLSLIDWDRLADDVCFYFALVLNLVTIVCFMYFESIKSNTDDYQLFSDGELFKENFMTIENKELYNNSYKQNISEEPESTFFHAINWIVKITFGFCVFINITNTLIFLFSFRNYYLNNTINNNEENEGAGETMKSYNRYAMKDPNERKLLSSPSIQRIIITSNTSLRPDSEDDVDNTLFRNNPKSKDAFTKSPSWLNPKHLLKYLPFSDKVEVPEMPENEKPEIFKSNLYKAENKFEMEEKNNKEENNEILSSPSVSTLLSSPDKHNEHKQIITNEEQESVDTYKLALWRPPRFSVVFASMYSPIQLVILLLTPSISIKTLLLYVLITCFVRFLILDKYEVKIEDRELVFKQLLKEYNKKYVYPRLNKKTVDVAVDATVPQDFHNVSFHTPVSRSKMFLTHDLSGRATDVLSSVKLNSTRNFNESFNNSFAHTSSRQATPSRVVDSSRISHQGKGTTVGGDVISRLYRTPMKPPSIATGRTFQSSLKKPSRYGDSPNKSLYDFSRSPSRSNNR
ncbi:hypothetical protein B5S32_g910 [[Candida] boidinii]|nr:hypothetical protein B5S32_g910 [[Candida] boidinii]